MSPVTRATARSDLASRPSAGLGRGLAVLLVAAVLAVYAPARLHEFVNYDDPDYVSENRHVRSGISLENVRWAMTTGHAANWHPLTWVSHMLDCELFGLDATGHHWTNVVIHTGGALALFAALARMTGTLGPAAFVAALFAVHPLHVESVAWVAERKDVLAGLCWMLTLLAYQRYAVQPALRRYLVTLLCFALGLMSKPMVVTLPLVLLLLDAWPLGRLRERGDLPALAWEKAPFFALAAGAGAITFWAQRRAGVVADLGGPALGTRAANALVSAARYILQTAWPSGLAIFYPFRPPSAAAVAGAAAALGGISLVVALVARRHPAVAVGWLWYLLTLLPVIGLLQVGNQGMADRYTYIPSVGLFIAVAWGLPSVLPLGRQRSVLLGAVASVLVVACMAAAARQARVWRDSRTLFAHALGVTSDNYVAHNNLGRALAAAGDLDEALAHYEAAVAINPGFAYAQENLGLLLGARGRADEALVHLRMAVARKPRYPEGENNLGNALLRRGNLEEAIPHYRAALALDPELAEAHNNLGVALEGVGRPAEAIREWAEALRLRPGYASAEVNLGDALARNGRPRDAAAHYAEAARLQPEWSEVHARARLTLGDAWLSRGEPREAVAAYREALRWKPDWPDATAALASVLATSADAELRDGAEAIRLAEEAAARAGTPTPSLLDVLASAYAEAGRFREATGAAQHAVEMARASGQEEAARAIAGHLALYRTGVPLHRSPPAPP